MRHAVIVAHPSPDSFTLAMATAWCEAAQALGHETVLRDLYRLHFDPLLKDGEIPRPSGYQAAADVVAERKVIGEADTFVLVYPLWFYLPPAALVGYIDRVFGMGFGYGPVGGAGNAPLLAGRRLISVTASGAPTAWLDQEGALAALRQLFDRHFAQVCGLTVLDHLHVGGVTASLPAAAVAQHLAKVRQRVAELCG